MTYFAISTLKIGYIIDIFGDVSQRPQQFRWRFDESQRPLIRFIITEIYYDMLIISMTAAHVTLASHAIRAAKHYKVEMKMMRLQLTFRITYAI